MQINFPDGSMRAYADGMNAFDIAGEISPRLPKSTFVCEIDGKVSDAFRPIEGAHSLKLLSFDDEGGRLATVIPLRTYCAA